MAELRRRLDELAGRGRPRGAVRVWSDATTGGASAAGGAWRRQPAVTFLAAVVGVALLGSALVDLGDGGDGGGGATDPTLIASSRLAGFESCDALLDHLKAAAAERVGPYGLGGGVIAFEDFAGAGGDRRELAGSASDDDAAPPDGSSQTGDSSTTNVQEAGVDEPDVVKTDGSIVYALARGRLWAVEQRGAPTILGSVAVTSGESMLLVGDRLLVVGSGGREVQPLAARRSAGMIVEDGGGFLPAVTVTVVDVSEPAAMAVTDSFDVDGGYVSARLVDGIARIVVRSHGPQLDFVYPSTGSASAMARATEVNRGVVEASTLADWLPTYRHDGDDDREPAYDCDRVYAPTEFSGFGMLTVLTVDPTDPRPDGTTTVVADGETVYASTGRLYVATNRWETVPAGGGEPGSGTATIEPGSPVTRPAPDVHTLVHSFDIRGDEPARYLVSGRVRGTLLNQFSMSEHEGDLRVATTDRSDDGSTSESFVTVLTDDGETLRQVGQVGGLGRDEQIYAVRFLGDKGYVVTFRRTDPLYVLDLSDPASPRVTGELKIPGYSAYLHPLEGDLLIGVGQDATAEGRVVGTQVSLFDVSDPTAPVQLQQRTIGAGGSAAEYDHHAFLHWAATDLTIIPMQEYDRTGPASYAVGLRLRPDGITELGRVVHPAPGAGGSGGSGGSEAMPAFAAPIERSLVIAGRLVTFSAAGLLSSDLDTLAPGPWVPFT